MNDNVQETEHNAVFMMPSDEVLKKYFPPATKEYAKTVLGLDWLVIPDCMKVELEKIVNGTKQ